MKKILFPFALAVIIICGIGASTIERGPMSTSSFWRGMLTNEDWLASLNGLHVSPGLTNYNWSFVGPTNQFILINSSSNFVGTLNGGTLTNLTATNIVGTLPNSVLATNIPLFTNVPIGGIGYYNGSNWVTSTNLLYTNGFFEILFGNVVVAQITSNGVFQGNGLLVTNVASTNVVGILTTNQITKNTPYLNGSIVFWRSSFSNYIASTNITFDGSVLTVTNQGSAAGTTINTNGNVFSTGFIDETGPLTNRSTSFIPTNTAPLAPTFSVLTSGAFYTTPPQRGLVTASCIYSNGAAGWLSNSTSHSVRFFGGVNYLGTNYASQSVSTSPGDQVVLTNTSGSLLLLNSEFSGN